MKKMLDAHVGLRRYWHPQEDNAVWVWDVGLGLLRGTLSNFPKPSIPWMPNKRGPHKLSQPHLFLTSSMTVSAKHGLVKCQS